MARLQPSLHNTDDDMIPKPLLRAMAALALSALALVSYAVLTDRPTVGQPHAATIAAEREIRITAHGDAAVTVHDADGALIVDLDNGGFIDAVHDGLARERFKQGVANTHPVRLIEFENGRFSLQDPQTGWGVELHAFGAGNMAAFERLMAH